MKLADLFNGDNRYKTAMAISGMGAALKGQNTGPTLQNMLMMDMMSDKREKEREGRERAGSLLSGIFGGNGNPMGGTPPFNPAGSARASPVGSPRMSGGETPKGVATDAMVALGQKTEGNPYRDAIASIESAGSGDYAAVGPTHPEMGRALGRYQVMESNIGPWSREVLGREVTPEQFLATPQIQDAIFDAKFGKYVERFGPEGAAQAWFSGPGGVGDMGRRDALGTTNADYTAKFNSARGGQPQGSYRTAQAGQIDPRRAMQILQSPYVDDSVKSVVAARLRAQMEGPDDDRTSLRQNVEWIMSQNPGMSFDEALGMARSGTNVTVNNQGEKGPQFGTIPQGYALYQGPDGSYRMAPIPGGPAAREQEEAAAAEERAAAGRVQNETNRRDVVLETTGAIRDMLDSRGLLDLPEAGIIGSRLTGANQEAADMAGMLDTLKGMVAFDRLYKLRQASATGASGLGQVTDREISLLAAQLGALDQTLSPDRIRTTLDTIEDVFGKLSPAARDYIMGQGSGDVPQGGFQGSGASQGDMTFDQFSQDPSAQAAAERYGVTLEEMWEIKQGMQ